MFIMSGLRSCARRKFMNARPLRPMRAARPGRNSSSSGSASGSSGALSSVMIDSTAFRHSATASIRLITASMSYGRTSISTPSASKPSACISSICGRMRLVICLRIFSRPSRSRRNAARNNLPY